MNRLFIFHAGIVVVATAAISAACYLLGIADSVAYYASGVFGGYYIASQWLPAGKD